jgi:Lon protease-like protein
MAASPMFPLGSVLLPSMFLPLHVFEPRYRALVADCIAGDHEFGVVLIERGSEVGGGDQRTSVGTMARIVEAVELPDGRWAIGAVGVRRIKVERWLEDDPYPRAEVTDFEPEHSDDDADPTRPSSLTTAVAAVTAQLRRVLALAAEMGLQVAPATQELSEDPLLASYQLVALSPCGPADQQRLLEAPTAEARVEALAALLAEEETVLLQQFALQAAEDEDPS